MPGTSPEVSGYYMKRRLIFMGRWIRWGGCYPIWLLRIFRHRKGWTVCDRVKGKTTRAHVTRWHFEYGVEVAQTDKGFEAFVDGVCLGIRLDGERVRARLYRDNQWLRENPLRPGEAAPWVLDLRFGGTGDDAVEMEFTIVKSR